MHRILSLIALPFYLVACLVLLPLAVEQGREEGVVK